LDSIRRSARGSFPTDEAATKLIYLAIQRKMAARRLGRAPPLAAGPVRCVIGRQASVSSSSCP
ncbi:hypothetical protein AB9K41_02905, partial [Cribrihabitans sp. XS_ASV171]